MRTGEYALAIVVCVTSPLTACGNYIEDSGRTGLPDAAGCTDDTAPDAGESAETLETLNRDLFRPRCLSCHDTRTKEGDLDFTSTDTAYESLFEGGQAKLAVQPVARGRGKRVVVAGDPLDSFLYQKLFGSQEAQEGQTMPPNNDVLSLQELERVRTWIREGARKQ